MKQILDMVRMGLGKAKEIEGKEGEHELCPDCKKEPCECGESSEELGYKKKAAKVIVMILNPGVMGEEDDDEEEESEDPFASLFAPQSEGLRASKPGKE